MEKNVYAFSVNNIEGEEILLSEYRGKVLLIVNTASKCGFTKQYEGLQKLYEKHKDSGLVILGFPCNQFGKQEPGGPEQIKSFCTLNYGVSFPMFEKIKVNGKDAHPLYKFLKDKKTGILGSAIKWNFTKFLVDRDGIPVQRFAPNTTPDEIEKNIIKLIRTRP
ncbi:MAG: glutathione peroxidase [Victivallales bacterium]|nr:glutathione peroxidase [Victivallales bacterium]